MLDSLLATSQAMLRVQLAAVRLAHARGRCINVFEGLAKLRILYCDTGAKEERRDRQSISWSTAIGDVPNEWLRDEMCPNTLLCICRVWFQPCLLVARRMILSRSSGDLCTRFFPKINGKILSSAQRNKYVVQFRCAMSVLRLERNRREVDWDTYVVVTLCLPC